MRILRGTSEDNADSERKAEQPCLAGCNPACVAGWSEQLKAGEGHHRDGVLGRGSGGLRQCLLSG
jgi:hypothetical protein